MNRQEQLDAASILLRVSQIDRQSIVAESEHWLWDRVRTCDFPRLEKYITEPDLVFGYNAVKMRGDNK
jgi:hypothetical protein